MESFAISAFEHSLALDGVNDYVQIAHHSALSLNDTNGFTLEAWIRPSSTDGYDTIITKSAWGTGGEAYWLGLHDGLVSFSPRGSSNLRDGNTTLPTDVWTHVAVVWVNSGLRRYYINGDLDYSGSAGSPPLTNGRPLSIGIDVNAPLPFHGNIAEVRVWNAARSQDDIRRTMHVALDEPRPGLVANWHLSDDYTDNIGSHDGTPRNGASLTGPQAPPQPHLVPYDCNFNALPVARYGAATSYVPDLNQALFVGGTDGAFHHDQIYTVDVSTGDSSLLGTFPVDIAFSAAAYVPTNGTVYVLGGQYQTPSFTKDTANIRAIDPATGVARTIGDTLPEALRAAVAVYHAGLDKIVVLGGRSGSTRLATITVFDPTTETVAGPLGVDLPDPRSDMAAAYSSATGKIYYFGGLDGSGAATDTIYEVALQPDGLNGSVNEVGTARLPMATYGLAAVEDPISHLIYLLGGSGSERVMVFDPVTGQLWETSIGLEERIYASVIYSHRNRQAVLMGGAEPSGAPTTSMWRIPLGDGPPVPLGRWDFPTPVGDNVTAIDGDERRVLVATDDDGAWRYDEYGTRYHYTAGILGSARVNDVRYDAANDHVWMATNDAGGKLGDGGTITTYGSSVLGTNTVYAVDVKPGYTDPDGAPFFGTIAQGLRWRARSSTYPYDYQWTTDFSGSWVKALAHRASGDLWLIVNDTLHRMTYNDYGSTSETDYGYPCGVIPDDLAFGPNGDWWLVAQASEFAPGGVCRIPPATIPGAGNRIEALIGTAATAVDVDADGRIWVSIVSQSGQSGGLSVYEVTGASSDVTRNEEYNWLNTPVGSSTLDDSSTLWDSGFTAVGAADERVWAGKGDGQLVTVAQRWQQLDESNDLDQKVIQGVWTVRGRAFLATSNSLHVLMPDGQSWDDRSGVRVRSVLGDSRGRIWVGTDTDVRLYTPTGWDMLTTVEGTPPAGRIYALAEDQDGRIWIGGAGGLTLFDRERFVATFTSANSDLPDDTVKALLVDRDNSLWIGTADGLARLRDGDWVIFTTAHGLADTAIQDLAQLGDGQLAISTDGSLNVYDGSSFSDEDPPVGPANLPLTVDELGRLWAGSAVRTEGGWQGYYWTNSGLSYSTISDNAADGADRVWFSHAPNTGISVRGTYLPPLADVIPTITGISPDHGSSGDEITVNGGGFGSNSADVDVTIGSTSVDVVSVSGDEISVVLNDNNISGDVSVSVGGRRVTLSGGDSPAFCAEPVISSFSPTGGNDGVLVDIHGSNFDPLATVSLGGGPFRLYEYYRGPTHLQALIQSGDGEGLVRVTNPCGSGSYTASSISQFRYIGLTLETVILNQGIESYGLVANRPTLIQHYLIHDVAPRSGDRLEVDTVEVTFTNPDSGESRSYEIRYPDADPVPSSGALTDVLLRDVVNSLNISLTPEVGDFLGFLGSELQVHTELRHRGYLVAESTSTAFFWPDLVMRVLLVPIMQEGYSLADFVAMQNHVWSGLDELERRIMPTGQVEFAWSDVVLTRSGSVDLGNAWELYTTSHDMDRARRQWNDRHDPDALIAFGVVDDRVATGVPGMAFWPDLSQLLNLLLLDPLDLLCDIGSALAHIFTFGFVGDFEGCHLEIPLYVGWANGDDAQISELFGHEFGHIMSLVKPYAPNGFDSAPFDTDNPSHSLTDELDGGWCDDAGASYNADRTLYRQPGVTEPVVNPITGEQFRGQLWMDVAGNPADEATHRGKAIMSYACERENDNVFYEPVDVPAVLIEFGTSFVRGFIDDLSPGGGLAATTLNAATSTTADAGDIPSPRPMPGQRLYVSGTVNKAADTGELYRVEVLGADAPLDASFATGYWLVQLNKVGAELARTGIFPVFSATPYDSATVVEHDTGFFATTILRQDDVTRIELRHNDTALDTFSAGDAVPGVAISSPTGGGYQSGTIPVTWTANDKDGDPLEIVIDYSADDGVTWTPVAFSSSSGTVEVPVYQLAGAINARFRVTASDGFNSGSAISEAFQVVSQPPRPYIGQPTDGRTFLEGQRIMLSGGADDNQDGAVADANLRWSSNRDGELGTGSELGVFLSVGTHILTLEAENSAGLTASTTVAVTVEGDYDYDGIPDDEELADGLNPLNERDVYSDADQDGLPLIMERKRGLDPNNSDSDGDGRSDADEIVEGTDPLTIDQPLPPDELSVAPTALVFDADLSVRTPLPQQQIFVASRAPVTWTLTADVKWLGASAATGSTPAGPTILVQAFELNDGVHTGTLTFTSDELGSTVKASVTVTITNSRAYFDVNSDDRVTVVDIMEVVARWGSNNSQDGFSNRHDMDRDGDIDVQDVLLVAARWHT